MGILVLLVAIYLYILPLVLFYYAVKFWKHGKKKLSLLFVSLIFLILSPIICANACHMCGIQRDTAYKHVVQQLQYKHLNINNLTYLNNKGTCRYTFVYKDKNQTIDYIISSSWFHNIHLSWYSHENNTSNN